MNILFNTHRILGEMVLPLLTVILAIYLTVVSRPSATRSQIQRLFPILVDIQAGLGIIFWVLLLTMPGGMERYLGFPFILHPILGVIAAGFAHMAFGARNPLGSLGRWAPLGSLGVLLVLVLANIAIASMN